LGGAAESFQLEVWSFATSIQSNIPGTMSSKIQTSPEEAGAALAFFSFFSLAGAAWAAAGAVAGAAAGATGSAATAAGASDILAVQTLLRKNESARSAQHASGSTSQQALLLLTSHGSCKAAQMKITPDPGLIGQDQTPSDAIKAWGTTKGLHA
jgi:hypothetical protein